jgi:DNA-directed RNA polymerase specialized sigma24 family protein
MDFEDFYGRYVDRVASYVLRHTSLRDAEDIVAETFTVAWRKRIERLDDPMPWLIVTARNVTRQVRRKEVSAGEITARLIDLIETSSPSAEITVQGGASIQVDVVANVPGLRERVVEVVGASIPLAISPTFVTVIP